MGIRPRPSALGKLAWERAGNAKAQFEAENSPALAELAAAVQLLAQAVWSAGLNAEEDKPWQGESQQP